MLMKLLSEECKLQVNIDSEVLFDYVHTSQIYAFLFIY